MLLPLFLLSSWHVHTIFICLLNSCDWLLTLMQHPPQVLNTVAPNLYTLIAACMLCTFCTHQWAATFLNLLFIPGTIKPGSLLF